ncbi:hypothetical protein V5O48_016247 [Marasmius crinis-equi]|uniref:Uncharacterized protein n=1 Tax=Marasmius crinis-equi TaxID=585013 RepID=A0ABR3ESJ8_9AGAR
MLNPQKSRKYYLPGTFPSLKVTEELASMIGFAGEIDPSELTAKLSQSRQNGSSSLWKKVRLAKAENRRILDQVAQDRSSLREEHHAVIDALNSEHSQRLQILEAQREFEAAISEQMQREVNEKALEIESLRQSLQRLENDMGQLKIETAALEGKQKVAQDALKTSQEDLSEAVKLAREVESTMKDINGKMRIVQREVLDFSDHTKRMFAEAQDLEKIV